MALKGGWINSWRQRLSMATSPDGCLQSPVFKAVSLCAPVSGEHGWEDGVVPCPAFSSLTDGCLATVWTECWTRWTLGLIQHGTSYVIMYFSITFSICLTTELLSESDYLSRAYKLLFILKLTVLFWLLAPFRTQLGWIQDLSFLDRRALLTEGTWRIPLPLQHSSPWPSM